jgi:hypothetical protein
VRDRDRSLHSYATYSGFDRAATRSYPGGTTMLCNPTGSAWPCHPVTELTAHPGFLHFGFVAADGQAVRRLRLRTELDGVTIVEYDDEPDRVSVKCLGPDGWRVEATGSSPDPYPDGFSGTIRGPARWRCTTRALRDGRPCAGPRLGRWAGSREAVVRHRGRPSGRPCGVVLRPVPG